jgi:putative Holliday junction resolvase
MRILAVDHGEKRIGLSLSDPFGMIATPFGVINHKSYQEDLRAICKVISDNEVNLVVVGLALDDEGNETSSSRRARKFGEGLLNQYQIVVEYFDESGTTKEAKQAAIIVGVRKKRRTGHMDSIAATLILQRYLDVVIK